MPQQSRKLPLIPSPLRAELLPETDRDDHEEQNRHRDHPAEVLRLERFILVSHVSRAAVFQVAAGRASKSASRDRLLAQSTLANQIRSLLSCVFDEELIHG